ncbi:MAG: hypothetical protein HY320_16390 [Armatimonadetes bacterium]|nr:hypothetical protein [Armatimonadota bacterium]
MRPLTGALLAAVLLWCGGSAAAQSNSNTDPRALPDFSGPTGNQFMVPSTRNPVFTNVPGLGVLPLPLPTLRGPDLFTFDPRTGFVPNSAQATVQQNRFFFLPGVGFVPSGQPLAFGNFNGANNDLFLGPGFFGQGAVVVSSPFPYLPALGTPGIQPLFPPLPSGLQLPVAVNVLPPGGAVFSGGAVFGTAPRTTTASGIRLSQDTLGPTGGPTVAARPGTLRERMTQGQRERVAGAREERRAEATPEDATTARLAALMRQRPVQPAQVEEVGATAVLVRIQTDKGPVLRRYPHEEVFFFVGDQLFSAARAPELLARGDQVLVPEPTREAVAGQREELATPDPSAGGKPAARRPSTAPTPNAVAEKVNVHPRARRAPARQPAAQQHR